MAFTARHVDKLWRYLSWGPGNQYGTSQLVSLPYAFSRLSSVITGCECSESGLVPEDPAICLACGSVLWAGKKGTADGTDTDHRRGACTKHALKCAGGLGVFFVVQRCSVLLVHKNRSAYSLSPYVDVHGEEDIGLKRGRPLYLSPKRYDTLRDLWRSHRVPLEVARLRNSADRVIIDGYY